MLGREDALKICETVLAHAKAAGAEDATVSLQSTLEFIREQDGRERDLKLVTPRQRVEVASA